MMPHEAPESPEKLMMVPQQENANNHRTLQNSKSDGKMGMFSAGRKQRTHSKIPGSRVETFRRPGCHPCHSKRQASPEKKQPEVDIDARRE